jgi:hypothetical protein
LLAKALAHHSQAISLFQHTDVLQGLLTSL